MPLLIVRYFDAVLRINRSRNKQIRSEAIEIAKTLNVIGVVPVFLKGATALLCEAYRDEGARIMGDLDMLVPEGSDQDYVDALRSIGYRG